MVGVGVEERKPFVRAPEAGAQVRILPGAPMSSLKTSKTSEPAGASAVALTVTSHLDVCAYPG